MDKEMICAMCNHEHKKEDGACECGCSTKTGAQVCTKCNHEHDNPDGSCDCDCGSGKK